MLASLLARRHTYLVIRHLLRFAHRWWSIGCTITSREDPLHVGKVAFLRRVRQQRQAATARALLLVAQRIVRLLREVLTERLQVRATRALLQQRERSTTVRRVLRVDQFRQDEWLEILGRARVDDIARQIGKEWNDVIPSD